MQYCKEMSKRTAAFRRRLFLFRIHITGSYQLDCRTIPSQGMPELHYIHMDHVGPYRILKVCFDYTEEGQSQWPRGLTRRSVAAGLQGLRVRIPPGAWISVCCDCCVLPGRGLCDELITRPEESYRLWCVVVCDLEAS